MSERRGTKALEIWCRRVTDGYENVKIINMSTSWRDGLAFCALIHSFRPDLLDFSKLNKENIHYNNELAFHIAEKYLGIPSLLDPTDMVKYEVPDRLSILTYLSQFYQVFGSQEPSNHSKNSTKKGEKTDELTTKMASPNRFGVPKREPCYKCKNPVFLAERLQIEKRLFHRSCLRCARCDTQLTLGSFYETENDGEYCCETCPDEEVHLVQKQAAHQQKSGKLQDRISFFENADKSKILKHSLSDEEKSKNMEAQKSSHNFVEMSNFLNKSLGHEDEDEEDDDDDDEDDSDNDEIDSQILRVKSEEIKIKDDVTKDTADIRLSDVLESQNFENVDLEFNSIEVPEDDYDESAFNNILGNLDDTVKIIPPKIGVPLEVPISDEEKIGEISENGIMEKEGKTVRKEVEMDIEPVQNGVKLVNEGLKAGSIMETGENSIEMVDKSIELVLNNVEPVVNSFESVENRVEPVENRVEPLENRVDSMEITVGLAEKSIELDEKSVNPNEKTVESVEKPIERSGKLDEKSVKLVEISMELVENTEPVENGTELVAKNLELEVKTIEPVEKITKMEEKTAEPTEKDSEMLKTVEKPLENYGEPLENCEEPLKINLKPIEIIGKIEEPVEKVVEPIKNVIEIEESVENTEKPLENTENSTEILEKEPTKIEEITEKVENIHIENPKTSKDYYPDELNPFGDDDEDEEKPFVPKKRVSMNPFGSDDEDDSTFGSPSKVKPPRPPPPKIKPHVSTNPFGSDEEDEEEIKTVTRPVASPRRTPVPTPRKIVNYNDSISSHDTSLSSNRFGGSATSLTSSLGSSANNSVARRKKGKAPPIPCFDKNNTLSMSNNSLSSDKTPKKKRPAPVPPPASTPIIVPEIADTTEITPIISDSPPPPTSTQRLIAVDSCLLNDDLQTEPLSRANSSESVVYRRTIIPLDDDLSVGSERQWEKMKDNKEAQNRNRQSQQSIDLNSSVLSNKSNQGKWKRRKGPAPGLPAPVPQKKILKMLPLQEIRQELEIIEIQQQGLEKQGVILEKMIRERCEGDASKDIADIQTNSKEVEDLIMQLFELVNEKNELFRRQAELMSIRRQHRLEQEQVDLEYEIRVLMAQPEKNKTDSDKAKEEALIARLVEIVQMRNEVVDCLEMDRLRENEEDLSIKHSIEERTAKREKEETISNANNQSPAKLSKKEKKKLKEAKKLAKSKKIDVEKDADESENPSKATKEKKKKRKFLF